jgi:integration host factor subunit alpha
MTTLTRADLVEAAYQAVREPSRADCEALLQQTLDTISSALVAGETVKISRFASFHLTRKKPRLARNPKRPTEEHIIPAHVAVRFKATRELRDMVKRGPTKRSFG